MATFKKRKTKYSFQNRCIGEILYALTERETQTCVLDEDTASVLDIYQKVGRVGTYVLTSAPKNRVISLIVIDCQKIKCKTPKL